MNHIVLAGEHLLVVFTEDGEYPLPEDKNADTGIIDITNWPFDIMRVNETNCMVCSLTQLTCPRLTPALPAMVS